MYGAKLHCSRSMARFPADPPDEGRELRAPHVPKHVDEEQAVLARHVAGAEHRAAPGPAGDVGDAEALVALDHHVGAVLVEWRAGVVLALDLAGRHAEARVLEELVDLAPPEARRGVDQVLVHLELVVAVRRPLVVVRHERGDVRQGRVPVRAGREDVVELRLAVLIGDRVRGGRSGRKRQRRHERSEDPPRKPPHAAHSSSRRAAMRRRAGPTPGPGRRPRRSSRSPRLRARTPRPTAPGCPRTEARAAPRPTSGSRRTRRGP